MMFYPRPYNTFFQSPEYIEAYEAGYNMAKLEMKQVLDNMQATTTVTHISDNKESEGK